MGGVWGREEETEEEETAGEEEEVEEEEEREEEEKEGEEIWRNGSLALGRKEGEEGSFEDEEVNRALVVNIKEKINKLEETVGFAERSINILTFQMADKDASLAKRVETLEVPPQLSIFSLAFQTLPP